MVFAVFNCPQEIVLLLLVEKVVGSASNEDIGLAEFEADA